MDAVHKVSKDQYADVLNWLEKYLPDSWCLHGAVREYVLGRWSGQFVYTIGWPDIKAAVVTGVDKSDDKCQCLAFFEHLQIYYLFSPDESSVLRFLDCPEIVNWDKPACFQFIPKHLQKVVHDYTIAKGNKCGRIVDIFLMTAEPGSIKSVSPAEGLIVKPLDPEKDAAKLAGNWVLNRYLAETFARDLIRRLPNVGLYDSSGNLLAFEVTKEDGTIGLLFVEEEHRGKGYSKVVATQLADILAKENIPAAVTLIHDNEASLKLHQKLGFVYRCDLPWIYHCPDKSSQLFYNDRFNKFF